MKWHGNSAGKRFDDPMAGLIRPSALAVVIFASLAVLVGSAVAATLPGVSGGDEILPSNLYSRAGRLVAVDGTRRLNLRCLGTGSPVVVMESGAWGGSMSWRKVQGRVAGLTQACSYDRAGLGFSDPATRESDARNSADDLYRLLRASAITLPIVLVGHSMGGLYVTLYASEHRSDVAGMVLVDPSFFGQDHATERVLTPAQRATVQREKKQALRDLQSCVRLAKKRDLRPEGRAPAICFRQEADMELTKELNFELARVQTQAAILSETRNFDSHVREDYTENDLETRGAILSLGDAPLIVLTRGNVRQPPTLSAATVADMEAVWKRGHDQLAAASSKGKSIVVPGSGHFIQLDQPQAVVDAIEEVVEDIRGKIRPR
jgi:pimeloyl-ACP methyl ester carboxylesterase